MQLITDEVIFVEGQLEKLVEKERMSAVRRVWARGALVHVSLRSLSVIPFHPISFHPISFHNHYSMLVLHILKKKLIDTK